MLEQITLYIDELLDGNWWIVHSFVIIFATLLLDFIQKRVLKHLEKRFQKTASIWDNSLVSSIRHPVTLFIWVLGISFLMAVFDLESDRAVREVGAIIAIAWALLRFVDQMEKNILDRKDLEGKPLDRTTADAITQLLKISVFITASLVMLQTLGVNISAILAFGGIGGIAIGFAAKDMLANFFGAMMIYFDRPFAIGDWVRSPDRNIEGTVEKIGWRLTIVRTFDKRPIYVPNSVFSSIVVENPSRMFNRRIFETIGVRYTDVDVLPKIIADVKAMLQAHPEIDQEQTLIVNFNSFGASSLDFFVYTFTKTVKWIEFHEVKQDVLFKISDIIASHGAEVAFPTRTLHMPDLIEGANLPQPPTTQ
ncbi:mechanosensitive ion channel family protein [Thiohalophilus sp.]|uniref:mechanosensitive ion channel family protein n=1 Tax=Thiohalophilus sp. TaxID=3028392 RepID=UPI002ACDBFF1|nr:mechanosensitive ion channel family protein [Thiohalophilus sp.]MDZ7805064.1 mechanosensitive ion channel family protein [Thiohalophilus sp.]